MEVISFTHKYKRLPFKGGGLWTDPYLTPSRKTCTDSPSPSPREKKIGCFTSVLVHKCALIINFVLFFLFLGQLFCGGIVFFLLRPGAKKTVTKKKKKKKKKKTAGSTKKKLKDGVM